MSVLMLCPSQPTALLFVSAADEAGLQYDYPQTDSAIFLDQIQAHKPDFALLTTDYLDQPDLFTHLRRSSPTTRIIVCVLPDAPTPGLLWPMLDKLEVDLFCLLTELGHCLRTVINGRFYISALLATHPTYRTAREPFPGWHDLTTGERRVLRLLAEGKSGPQIANALCISPKTVDNHKYKISQKLHIHDGPGSLIKFSLINREKILAWRELTYIK